MYPYFLGRTTGIDLFLINYANFEVMQHLMKSYQSIIVSRATKPMKSQYYKGKPKSKDSIVNTRSQ